MRAGGSKKAASHEVCFIRKGWPPVGESVIRALFDACIAFEGGTVARAKKTANEFLSTADDERVEDAGLPVVDGDGRDEDELDDESGDESGDDPDLLEDLSAIAASIPVSAEGRESARRLIDLLVEKELLALYETGASAKLLESVARALEWPGPPSRQASMLSNALVESDDVDELFVDDEMLTEILKRW